MSDESYRVQVTLNLPPTQQYEKGDMLNVRGNSFNEVELALAEVVGADDAKSIITRFFTVGTATAVGEQYTAGLVSAQTAGASVPQPVPMEVPAQTTTPAPVVAPAPAPVVAAPQAAAPQVGAPTPGIEYPDASKVGGTLLFGAPCPKCSVITFWQPPGTNFKTQKPFDGYWRCANVKNHS